MYRLVCWWTHTHTQQTAAAAPRQKLQPRLRPRRTQTHTLAHTHTHTQTQRHTHTHRREEEWWGMRKEASRQFTWIAERLPSLTEREGQAVWTISHVWASLCFAAINNSRHNVWHSFKIRINKHLQFSFQILKIVSEQGPKRLFKIQNYQVFNSLFRLYP